VNTERSFKEYLKENGMFEELFEIVAGPWALVALAVVALPAGRKAVRTVAREAVRAVLKTSMLSSKKKQLMSSLKSKQSASTLLARQPRTSHTNSLAISA
jgi:hypothetical protein